MFRKKVTLDDFHLTIVEIKEQMDAVKKEAILGRKGLKKAMKPIEDQMQLLHDTMVALAKQHNEEYKHIYQYVGRFNDILGHLLKEEESEQ